jgi:hypothetical protein
MEKTIKYFRADKDLFLCDIVKNKIIKNVLIVVFIAFITNIIRGQNVSNNSFSDSTALLRTASASSDANMPEIVPVSPNAASLGIYGSIPVGHYTGVPNISIPIYEVDLDGKKIPISISYHASGIKVAQEASTIGLGWALNAGGCITKEVHGWDDFSYNAPLGYYHDTNFPVATENNDLDRTVGTLADRIDNLVQYNANDKDSEPDLYSYNFGSYAGTAFFDKKTTDTNNYASVAQAIIRKGKDKLDIKRHTFVSAYNENDYWVITDVDGYKYYFGTAEVTTNYWKDPAQYPQFSLRNKQHKVITAWHLDSIVSPYANKVVFLYEFDNIQTITSTSEDVWYLLADTPPANVLGTKGKTYIQSYANINQALLKQIVLKNGTIVFIIHLVTILNRSIVRLRQES